MDLSTFNWLPLLAALMVASTPILLAGIGELVVEKAGVLNLGVEGMMITGAVCGFAMAIATESAVIGFVSAAVGGAVLSSSSRSRCSPSSTPRPSLSAATARSPSRSPSSTLHGLAGVGVGVRVRVRVGVGVRVRVQLATPNPNPKHLPLEARAVAGTIEADAERVVGTPDGARLKVLRLVRGEVVVIIGPLHSYDCAKP